jgi:DNA-binding LacI/PurR family transcriptional regulator
MNRRTVADPPLGRARTATPRVHSVREDPVTPQPDPPASRPRIDDVAQRAGVSVPTVSRVLTGAQRVSVDKRQRVLLAIAELGYRPSGAARALASGRPSTIAILAGNTSRFGYAGTIEGIEEAARAAGYLVLIAVIENEDAASGTAAVDQVLSQSIAGVIVLKFDPPGVAGLRALPETVRRVVVSGQREKTDPQAVIDEALGARQATEHLLELGHRTVHHLAIPATGRENGRTQGWRKALQQAGAPVPELLGWTWDPSQAREIGRQIGTTRPEITAVLCGNDEIAIGLIRGLQDSGRRVPEDVSVIGFDDHPLSPLFTPALTTVAQDFVDLGRRSFELLAVQLEPADGDTRPGPATRAARTRRSSRPAVLIVRESTGRPPVTRD